MVEYKKIFLDKIKAFLLYFIGFIEDKSILPKVYLKNYVVDSPYKKPIIMITDNENIFSANDGQQKIWT